MRAEKIDLTLSVHPIGKVNTKEAFDSVLRDVIFWKSICPSI
jgi:hypothetical protein